jgi:hypothetical protein
MGRQLRHGSTFIVSTAVYVTARALRLKEYLRR